MSLDKLPYSPNSVKVEKKVVDRIQHRRKILIRNKKMSQVCARIGSAHHAGASRIDRVRIFLIFRVLDDDMSVAGKKPAVTSMPRRHDAVEHVHTTSNALDQISRSTDSHQVARFVCRKLRLQILKDFIHQRFRLSDREASNRIPREIHRNQAGSAFAPELWINPALHDTE